MTTHKLRTNVLVELVDLPGQGPLKRVSARHSLTEEPHDSYDSLGNMDRSTLATDVQALTGSGGWVHSASIFSRDFDRPDWGGPGAGIAQTRLHRPTHGHGNCTTTQDIILALSFGPYRPVDVASLWATGLGCFRVFRVLSYVRQDFLNSGGSPQFFMQR